MSEVGDIHNSQASILKAKVFLIMNLNLMAERDLNLLPNGILGLK